MKISLVKLLEYCADSLDSVPAMPVNTHQSLLFVLHHNFLIGGSETGAIPYLRGISTSNCTGDEIGFDQCQPMPAVFQSCSRVRLNCPGILTITHERK